MRIKLKYNGGRDYCKYIVDQLNIYFWIMSELEKYGNV